MAAILVTLIPTLVIIVPLAILGTVAGVQVVNYVSEVIHNGGTANKDVFAYMGTELNKLLLPILHQVGLNDIDFVDLLTRNRGNITREVSGPIAAGLQSFIITIVSLVIALLATFFMVRDSHHMVDPVSDLIPLPKDATKKVMGNLSKTVRAVFMSIFLTSLIQGALAGIAYWVLGVPSALTWTFVTILACMIPLIGAPVVYVPIAVSLMLQGRIGAGIGLLIFGFGIISQIDQFLRSHFISSDTKIHQMAIFISLLGGVIVMGPVGLMVGPMLLTLILAMVDVMRTRQKLEDEHELEAHTELA